MTKRCNLLWTIDRSRKCRSHRNSKKSRARRVVLLDRASTPRGDEGRCSEIDGWSAECARGSTISDIELLTDLDQPFGRQLEEIDRVHGVAQHEGEQGEPPTGEP